MMQRKAFEYQIERQAMQIMDKQEQIELLEIMLEHEEVQEEEYQNIHYCEYLRKTDGIIFTGGS